MAMLDKLLVRDVDAFAKEVSEIIAKRYTPAL